MSFVDGDNYLAFKGAVPAGVICLFRLIKEFVVVLRERLFRMYIRVFAIGLPIGIE